MVEKVARGQERAPLQREAAALTQIHSRFVPRLIQFRDGVDEASLVTVDCGNRTIDEVDGLGILEIRRALIDCVSAVLDLHGKGWAHGSICPEHVVVGPRGRARLCSLGDARRITPDKSDSRNRTDSCDGTDARGRTDALDRTDSLRSTDSTADVAQVADVRAVIAVIARVSDSQIEATTRSKRREHRRLRRELARIASAALDALDADRAPSATLKSVLSSLERISSSGSCREETAFDTVPITSRSTSSGLLRLRPHLSDPRPSGPRSHDLHASGPRSANSPSSRLSRHNLGRPAPSILMLAMLTAIALTVREAPDSQASAPKVRWTTQAFLPGISPETTDALLDGDHRDGGQSNGGQNNGYRSDSVDSSSAPIVAENAKFFTVGMPGDQVAIDDWFCLGERRLALFRPSTGAVYIFDEWAIRGAAKSGREVLRRPDIASVESSADRCGGPVLHLITGESIEIDLETMGYQDRAESQP